MWRNAAVMFAMLFLSLAPTVLAGQLPLVQDLQLNCVDPRYIIAGDFNRDAHPDIVVACHSCNSVAFIENLGLRGKRCATFGEASFWELNDSPVALAAAHFIDKPRGTRFPYASVFPNVATVTQYLPGMARISPLEADSLFLSFANGSIDLVGLPFATLTHFVLADFNSDGAVDAALLDGVTPQLAIYLGKRDPIDPLISPNGSLASEPVTKLDLPGNRAYFMAAADFDRDGRPDLVLGIDGRVVVYANTTEGFSQVASVVIGTKVTGVAVADFNRDGYPDIAAVDPDFGTLAIIMNDGCGKFRLFTRIKDDGGPSFVAIIDCNRDNVPDMAVAERDKNAVRIVLTELTSTVEAKRPDPCGKTAGDLVDEVRFVVSHVIEVGPAPIGLAVADFDVDGMPDIAVALHGADGTDGEDTSPEIQVIYNPCSCQGCGGEVPCLDGEATAQTGEKKGEEAAKLKVQLKGPEEVTVGQEVSYNAVLEPFVEAKFHWQLAAMGESKEGEAAFTIKSAEGPTFVVVFDKVGTYQLTLTLETSKGTTRLEKIVTIKEAISKPEQEEPQEQKGGESSSEQSYSDFYYSTSVSTIEGGFSLMAAGDVTGDGKADLVLGKPDTTDVLLLTGLGNGRFEQLGSFDTGISPEKLLVADFTGNSLADILAINWAERQASLLIATRERLLPPRAMWLPQGAWDVVVDQLNDNRGMELVWLTPGGPKVWSFARSGIIIEWPNVPKSFSFVMFTSPPYVWTDVDTDGNRELVFYSHNPGEIEMMKLGVDSPITLTVSPTKTPLTQLDAADVDGDGLVDLLGLDAGGRLYVWLLSGVKR